MTELHQIDSQEPHPLGEELRNTPRVLPSDMALVQYLEALQARNRSATTIRTYTCTLAEWRDWLRGQHVFDASTEQMENFVKRRRYEAHGASYKLGSPATRKREVSTLRSFYTWAWEQDLTPTYMAKALHAPTVHNMNPKPVPEADWKAVWQSDLTDGERCMLGLGYFCGLRRAEITSIRPEQIGPVNIFNFVRKGGGDHTLPWVELLSVYADSLPQLIDPHHDDFKAAMGRLSRSGQAYMMPWINEPDPQSVNKRLSRIQANLEVTPFSPHQLRHSFVTNMLRAGVPLHLVSRLANHSNVTTTMRYVKATGSELSEWRKATNHSEA